MGQTVGAPGTPPQAYATLNANAVQTGPQPGPTSDAGPAPHDDSIHPDLQTAITNASTPQGKFENAQIGYNNAMSNWGETIQKGMADPSMSGFIKQLGQNANQQAQGVPGFKDKTQDQQNEIIGLRMAGLADGVGQSDKGQAAGKGNAGIANFFDAAHQVVTTHADYVQAGNELPH